MLRCCFWWFLALTISITLVGAELLDSGNETLNSTIEARDWTLVVFDTKFKGDRESTVDLRLLSTMLEGKTSVVLVDGPTELSLRERFRVWCTFPFPLYPTFRLVRYYFRYQSCENTSLLFLTLSKERRLLHSV